jgi:hypothetical protein
MADLSGVETTSDSCCAPEQRATCCEPSAKGDCCAPERSTCGCSAGQSGDGDDVREGVRERYAAAPRSASADEIADPDMDSATRADVDMWTGRVSRALTRDEFEQALRQAGLTNIEIRETHRVHAHAGAVIIRAQKPGSP